MAPWRVHSSQVTPRRWTWQLSRVFRDCLRTVLADPNAGIPEMWKTIPDWQAKILRKRNADYVETSGLFRFRLKENPLAFFRATGDALCYAPTLFWRQLSRGFRYNPECAVNPVKEVQDLIATFNAPWPPTDMSAGWGNRSSQRDKG